MKKIRKLCCAVALTLLAAGAALVFMARNESGRTAVTRAVEKITGGRVVLDLDRLWKWGTGMRDNLPNPGYDVSEAAGFDAGHEILEGDVQKFCLGGSVDALEIEAGGCDFRTLDSGDDFFYIETEEAGKFQAYVEDEVLYIRAVSKAGLLDDKGIWENCRIRFYVPQGYHYRKAGIDLGAGVLDLGSLEADEVSLKVGAGRLTANALAADSLSMEVGAGQIDMTGLQVKRLEAGIGMGALRAEGMADGDVKVDCAMGKAEFKLAGRREDFNYRLEGTLGSICLDEEQYSGLEMSKKIDNKAARDMEIKCSAGSISIKFAG